MKIHFNISRNTALPMKTKVCPVCNSTNIDFYSEFKFEERSGLMRNECRNCGFVGPMTEMERKDAKRLKVLKPKKSETKRSRKTKN